MLVFLLLILVARADRDAVFMPGEVPLTQEPDTEWDGVESVVLHVKDGVAMDEARAELSAILGSMDLPYIHYRALLVPMRAEQLRLFHSFDWSKVYPRTIAPSEKTTDCSDIRINTIVPNVRPRYPYKFYTLVREDEYHLRMRICYVKPNILELENNPDVGWAEYVPREQVLNYWSGQTVRGEVGEWNGMTGLGEVVGVADTGMDIHHCFFEDTEPVGASHRKIRSYEGYADTVEEAGGHGTHVCGTIAGYSVGNPYVGVAHNARIAMYDIHKAGEQYLRVPDLRTTVFPAAYSVGARIHSNSWGSSESYYSSRMQQLDRYTWEHKDFLVVVSAGNSGASGTDIGTVGSPAGAKNALAVGSSANGLTASNRYWSESSYVITYRKLSGVTISDCASAMPFSKMWPSSITSINIYRAPGTMAYDCYGSFSTLAFVSGHATLLPPIDDPLCVKNIVKVAKDRGVRVLLFSNRASGALLSNVISVYPTFGTRDWFNDNGNTLLTLSATPAGDGVCAAQTPDDSYYGTNSVSSFSSSGPTWDGRTQPMVVAPGEYIFSAWAGATTCDSSINTVRPMRGTSMAAPAVAGAAALVRECLRTGCINVVIDSPSAATLRAALVHSARRINGNTGTCKLPGGSAPDNYQGYGLIDLHLLDDAHVKQGWSIPLTSSSKTTRHRWTVQSTIPVIVTLSWTDAPASVGSSRALINDLDLVVRHVSSGSERYGNMGSRRDRFNPVEKLNMGTMVGTFWVDVIGYAVDEGAAQPYSLVVTASSISEEPVVEEIENVVDPDNTWNPSSGTRASSFIKELRRLLF